MSRRRHARVRGGVEGGRPTSAGGRAHRAGHARRARGDRGANDAHYLHALDYAQQAGDVLQLVRVRTNRGSRHVEECSYEEAISELDHALRLADLTGFVAFRALALSNRGEALCRLGRFDEAIADLEASRALYQRLGSRMVSYPLEKLGEVYRIRGDVTLARAAYEEAVRQAEEAGDVQGLVPALTGLAGTIVADEPDEAERLAERALALGPGMNQVQAQLTAGWIALGRGDTERAARYASDAAADAGRRRDRAALAESLELRALAGPAAGRDTERLAEAETIWRELGNPAGQARTALVGALLSGDDEAARRAEATLAEVGARGYRTALALVHPLTGVPPVVVQSLGRFRVLLSGEPVPLGAWQSRKARDLLKLLVARRGRPTPRDVLMEALWPEQGPAPLGNRLSVLLSTIRSVLDPGKRHDQDHFVGADKNAVWLDRANLSIDVEEFLEAAEDALVLYRAGKRGALSSLTTAEAAYTGDFLEEDAYEDWTVALREEARATYTAVARALADDAAARGDVDATTRYSLRSSTRPVRRARPSRARRNTRRRGAARRSATPVPHVLRTDGRDRRRVGSLPGRTEASVQPDAKPAVPLGARFQVPPAGRPTVTEVPLGHSLGTADHVHSSVKPGNVEPPRSPETGAKGT